MLKIRKFPHLIVIPLIFFTFLKQALNYKMANNTCNLPESCRIDTVHLINNLFAREFVSTIDANGFVCDAKDETSHVQGFNEKLAKAFKHERCLMNKSVFSQFSMRFPRNLKAKLNNNLNLKGILEFLVALRTVFEIEFIHLSRFDVNLNIERLTPTLAVKEKTIKVNFLRANIDFYANDSLVRSCQDLVSTYGPSWSPNTIFQIQFKKTHVALLFLNCRFK